MAVSVNGLLGSIADKYDDVVVIPACTRVEGVASYTKETVTKTVADVQERPIVKEMIAPATTAVATGVLTATDIVVE